MDRIGSEEVGQRASIRKGDLASRIGSTVEWYAYFNYGTATAQIFGQLFFSSENLLTGTLAA